jgi:DNA-binding NarL/FixJ family response regulator
VENRDLQVVLVEDHANLRDILLEYIGDLPAVAGCNAFESAEAALTRFRESQGTPDLLLIDLSLPGMNGIELIRELRRHHRALPLAILSGHRSLSYAHDAFAAGADGYLLKGDMDELERGMHAIRGGKRYMSAGLEYGA